MALKVLDTLWRLAGWASGPILGKELRVSSRRRRNFALRTAYVGLLVVFVMLVWLAVVEPHVHRTGAYEAARMSEAGKAIVCTVVWFQLCALQLVAVIMLSAGISGEIQARTLGMLMSTPIHSAQIVIGKLLSKLLQLVILLAISLPLLAVVRVFGGVPWEYVLSSVCITFTACLLAGSVALLFSVLFRRAYASILVTLAVGAFLYAVLPGVAGLLMALTYMGPGAGPSYRKIWESALVGICHGNPFFMQGVATADLFQPGASGSVPFFNWPLHCGVMLGLSAIAVFLCVLLVRRVALRQAMGGDSSPQARAAPPVILPVAQAAGPTGPPTLEAAPVGAFSTGRIRRIRGSPVLWKELRTPLTRSLIKRVIGIVVPLSVAAVVYVLIGWMGDLDEGVVQVMFVCAYTIIGIFVTMILSATTITSEKEAQSWPLLLSTTLSNGQILWGKFAGVARRCWCGWVLLAGHLAAFVLAGVLHPVVLVHMTMVTAWIFIFLTGTGLYFSTLFRKTTSAVVMNLALVATLWVIVPILLAILSPLDLDKVTEVCLTANPVIQAGVLTDGASSDDFFSSYGRHSRAMRYHWPTGQSDVEETTEHMAAYMGVYSVAGLVFALCAQRRFRRKVF
ncbi:MAG: ABC transporter permease [Planctomycetota bacterium]|jgi:ABC-type transport system involved in multi-copper enzyme maturation permease subunit